MTACGRSTRVATRQLLAQQVREAKAAGRHDEARTLRVSLEAFDIATSLYHRVGRSNT